MTSESGQTNLAQIQENDSYQIIWLFYGLTIRVERKQNVPISIRFPNNVTFFNLGLQHYQYGNLLNEIERCLQNNEIKFYCMKVNTKR